jgi:hypothetical protein
MSALPDRDSLAYALELAVMLGRDAGRLAQDMARFQPGATPERHALLNRLENALRDLALAVENAIASLSPATRATIIQAR